MYPKIKVISKEAENVFEVAEEDLLLFLAGGKSLYVSTGNGLPPFLLEIRDSGLLKGKGICLPKIFRTKWQIVTDDFGLQVLIAAKNKE